MFGEFTLKVLSHYSKHANIRFTTNNYLKTTSTSQEACG